MPQKNRFNRPRNYDQLRAFFSVRGNRQLVFSLACISACISVLMFAVAWWNTRTARLHAEQHAVELANLDEQRQLLRADLTMAETEVATLRTRLVSQAAADAFRNQITGLIRETGCRLRNVTPGDHDVRRWMEEDDLNSDDYQLGDFDEEPIPTPYSLVTQSLSLQVTGEFEHIRQLVDAVQQLSRAAHTRSLVVQTDGDNGLTLDWDLLFYDLESASAEFDW